MFLCCLLSAFGMSLTPAAGQTVKPTLAVTISLEAPATGTGPGRYTAKAGSEIFVTVHITNTSNRNLSLDYDSDSRTGVGFANRYEIRGTDGSLLTKRAITHPEIRSSGHGWPARVLEPGASMDIPGDHVSRLYNLDRPGEYTIQLSRAFGDHRERYISRSNSIRLTLTD
jgi:hypothetical protein